MAGQLKKYANRIKSYSQHSRLQGMKMVVLPNCACTGCYYTNAPYANKAAGNAQHIVSQLRGGSALKLAENAPVEKCLLIVITATGAWRVRTNSAIVKLAKETIATKYSAQAAKGNVAIWNIGKKVLKA